VNGTERERATRLLLAIPDSEDRVTTVAEALAAERARALRDFADLIDRGPTFPLPPSIFSAMARERADDQEQS
jgi:hypothetical protein